jgi:hypothetical protein
MKPKALINLICPVDNVQINENKVRLTAAFVLLIGIIYLLTHWVGLILLLTADFALRAFKLPRFSLLGFWAEATVWQLNIPFKATDQAPKRFAAKVGFVFCLIITVRHFLNENTWILSSILVVFAFLESVLAFCAGCYAYTFYAKLITRKTLLAKRKCVPYRKSKQLKLNHKNPTTLVFYAMRLLSFMKQKTEKTYT